MTLEEVCLMLRRMGHRQCPLLSTLMTLRIERFVLDRDEAQNEYTVPVWAASLNGTLATSQVLVLEQWRLVPLREGKRARRTPRPVSNGER